jgi:hypothetical protein
MCLSNFDVGAGAAAWHSHPPHPPWVCPSFSESIKFTEKIAVYFIIRNVIVHIPGNLKIVLIWPSLLAVMSCAVLSVSNRIPAVEMSVCIWSQMDNGCAGADNGSETCGWIDMIST